MVAYVSLKIVNMNYLCFIIKVLAMEKMHVKRPNLIFDIINEKCPKCGQSHVFQKSKKIFEMPLMYETCSHCQYKFDREPGYFLGAMYISYGIAVLVCILVFLLFYFALPSLPIIYSPVAMAVATLLIAKKNYKISRIIYIHLFPW